MSEKEIGKVTNPGPQPEELRHEQWEWLRVTLSNIGDAVITTDNNGYVNFLNPVAQSMTGWTPEDAIGKPLGTVFKIINEVTRLPVENPAAKALREGVVVGLANHTMLIAKDRAERPIEDSAAPTLDAAGKVNGVAIVFRDVTERKRLEREVQDARAYADNILATLRDPFLVLDKGLQVVTANHAFYENFHVAPDETQGRFVYELGDHQWDIPRLRTLLEQVLTQNTTFQDFEVEHEFATVGRKVMLLNARRMRQPGNNSELILLAIEDITERRQMQQQLEISETRFRRLFEAAHDGILILDAASRKITHVNPFLTKLLDYPPEHFLGKQLWEIGLHHDKQSSQAAMQELYGKGSIRYEDLPLEDRHGRTHPVEMVANVYQEDHHPVIQCNIRDISERKQAEEALHKAGALQSAIFNSANFSSIATDEKGVIQIFNVGAERMLGYTAAEVMNTITPADISDPQELITRAKALSMEFATTITPGFEALVFKAARGIEDIYELTYIRQDGSRFPAVVSVTALRDAQDIIIGYLLIGTDNTARKQVEAERMLLDQRVRDQQFYTRSLIESNIDALMTTDPRGIISDVNKQMEALTGCTRDELIGAPFKDYFTDPERAEAGIKLVLAEGKVTDYELTARGRDGQETVVSYNATTFHDRDLKLQGVFAAARDITERNRLELQMRQQKAKLSDLHRRKDEFLAMLSHELRSPLAPIANAVQLLGLQRGSENAIQQQARGIIERQMGQLQHLVNDLLEVSRITTGRVQLRLERVAVSGIMEVAVETVRPLIEQRRHELTISLPPEPIWLYADAARLEQVVANLLANAAKYTEEGGHIWLTVELEEDKEMGRQGVGETRSRGDGKNNTSVSPSPPLPLSPSHIVIRVGDTGVGITAALLPCIFDLFTQAERSLDRSQGGLGIGLALVHRLTDLHGGTVEASSVLGQGSEFVVRLPVLADTPLSTLPVTETGQPTTRPLRVLVVDDNEDTVLSFSMLLCASGHDVRTAHDGPSAVQAAIAYRPDVVLLDIGLPGLTGYEVAKRIRQHPNLKDVMLVALTGYGQDSDRQASHDAGFNHHLVKPARLEQLQQILASISELVA